MLFVSSWFPFFFLFFCFDPVICRREPVTVLAPNGAVALPAGWRLRLAWNPAA
ncbi:MAG TPA: hypothetical protein VG433_02510 [Pirellulales bacterium]|nr:hypothetical protein [Pirellulales bacterium]